MTATYVPQVDDDETPQLGGALDTNGYEISGNSPVRLGSNVAPGVNGHLRAEKLDIQYRDTVLPCLVTFTFDDGYDTDLTVMKPVFDSQGEVATCAIYTDGVGASGRMTWANLVSLQADGWEILSHTKTHATLSTLSESQVITELSSSKDTLTAQGLAVENFVNPTHGTSEAVRALIKRYYRSARSTTVNAGVNLRNLNTYCLDAYLADSATDLQIKARVDAAESAGRWLIIYLHHTDAADATKIDTVIDYVQSKGIPIVTVRQALDLLENVYETGDLGEGRAFAVNPAGDVRCNEVHAVGSVDIWNPDWPSSHNVGIDYSVGDLRLRPYSTRDVKLHPDAVSLRPGDRRVTELGQSSFEWATVWATGMASSYGDLTLQAANDIILKTGGSNTRLTIDETGVDFHDGSSTTVASVSSAGMVVSRGFEPQADDSYYLGKNSVSSPKAWKGLALKDTANGNYYRIEVTNGSIVATQIT